MSNPASSASGDIAGVILAAGESSRMGRDKALLPLGSHSFLEHIAATLDGEVSRILVVLGHHADEIAQQVHLPASTEILQNPDYTRGQLSSLRIALRLLEIQPVGAALVCLVDHPGISKEVVRVLARRFHQTAAPILIPTCQGRRGHPVLFAQRLFAELLSAPLGEGARAVVHAHASEIEQVEVSDEGVLWDVDRPEDYDAVLERWNLLNASRPSSGPA